MTKYLSLLNRLIAGFVIIAICSFAYGYVNASGGEIVSGGGSGSGDVGAGTIGQVPYYAANGTSVVATSSILINTDGTVTFAQAITAPSIIITGIASSTTYRAGVGSAASPSYSYAGDTNTGIFKCGADCLAWSNGASETMRLNANGYLGIGTTTASSMLSIGASVNIAPLYISSSSNALMFELDKSGNIQIANNSWIRATDNAGTGVVNMFKVTTSDTIEVGAELTNLGSYKFEEDSGAVTHTTMAVSASAADGTEESFSWLIDGSNIFKLKALSNGAGGVDTLQTIIYPGSLHSGNTFPALAFGDGDTGISENTDDTLTIQIANNAVLVVNAATGIRGTSATSPALLNEASSATNPGLVSNYNDLDTGIGWAAADKLSLIAGGVNGINIVEAASDVKIGISTTTPATEFDLYDATATSTMYIYSGGASLGGEIIMEDNDGAGCTRCTTLDGTMTCATVTCP